jgi:hypothetical protein
MDMDAPGEGGERVRVMQEHYNRFLAAHYLWMAGGFDANAEKSRRFFTTNGIVPRDARVAIDLGAGCGIQSVPLAEAGFEVHAVDLSRKLLDELVARSGSLPITVHEGNILDYSLWGGHQPGLILCMGDTLTYLPDMETVRDLISRCYAELGPGGKFITTFRDYSVAAEGVTDVIPVQRDTDHIFLCRLEYTVSEVNGTDILYEREGGRWSRTSGRYSKLRIRPWTFRQMLTGAGFRIAYCSTGSGILTTIAEKAP